MKNLKVCNAHSYLYPRSRFKGSQDLLIIVHWIAASQEDEMMCKFTIAIITFSPAKLCEVVKPWKADVPSGKTCFLQSVWLIFIF
jgi:hypothetical protein